MFYLFLIIACAISSNTYSADSQSSLESLVANLKKPTAEYQEAYSIIQKHAEDKSSDADIKNIFSLTQDGKSVRSSYDIPQLQATVSRASESGHKELASALSAVINASLDRFQPEEPNAALGDFDRVSVNRDTATETDSDDFEIILSPNNPSHTNQ